MYINCLPSRNGLLKFEDKQFAQLAQVSLLLFFSFLTVSQLCVLPSASGGHEGQKVMFSAFHFLDFPWFGGPSFLSFGREGNQSIIWNQLEEKQ